MDVQTALELLKGGASAVRKWNSTRPRRAEPRPSLRGAALAGLDLSKVDFADMDLRDADLSGSVLRGGVLRNAQLSGAQLVGCDLREVDFSLVQMAGANLSGGNLYEAELGSVDLRDVDLSAADLRFAYLSFAQLDATQFAGADLRGADLRETRLRASQLAHAECDDRTRLPEVFLPEVLEDPPEVVGDAGTSPDRQAGSAPEAASAGVVGVDIHFAAGRDSGFDGLALRDFMNLLAVWARRAALADASSPTTQPDPSSWLGLEVGPARRASLLWMADRGRVPVAVRSLDGRCWRLSGPPGWIEAALIGWGFDLQTESESRSAVITLAEPGVFRDAWQRATGADG